MSRPLVKLKIKNIRKNIADFSLHADFTVDVGERVALCGKSGSGKTSLLRILAGLDLTDSRGEEGQIFLGDVEITQVSPQLRNVGFVFQEQVLFPTMSVLENAAFGLKMKRVKKEERNSLALEWLSRVGLKARAEASVSSLSGGEKQRLAFVRALIWKPSYILLDEPFSSQDPELREILRKELVDLHKLWPAPLVLVTHDEKDIQDVATARLELKLHANSSVRSVTRC